MTFSSHSQSGVGSMFHRKEHSLGALPCALVVLFFARGGFAQAPQPTSLSLSPATVSQGQCYTVTVGNGANMTLDVQYRFNHGAVQTTLGWPSLNASGQASICTSSSTAVGTYTYVAIRNTLNTTWVTVSATITVTGPPDFTLSVSPSSRTIDQGQSTSYTVSVSALNGFNSSVSLSVSGMPAGASASFTANPVAAGGSTTLNVSTSTTASTGSFTW